MKKLLLSLFLLIGSAYGLKSFAQTNFNLQVEKTRTAYLYIVEVEDSSQSNVIDNYFNSFNGKVVSSITDANNHMCIVVYKHFSEIDLIEILKHLGYTGFIKDEMPPAGQRYVYNPDGTWKIKAL